MLPNFLYIGAAKCGSTWFYEALKAHPQVFVPTIKDIYFFDEYYHKGLQWYEKMFSAADPSKKAIGELSHNYLFSYEAAARIRKTLPNVKLIASLRNPIERAFSVYLFNVRNGSKVSSFREMVRKSPLIIERGRYSRYVEHYYKVFGKDKVKIFLFDDLEKNPFLLIRKLYKFLGVNKDFYYKNADKKVLPAARPRIRLFGYVGKKSALILRKLGLTNVVGKIKYSFIKDILFKPILSEEKEKLSEKDRVWLLDYFYDDIKKLEKLLNHNLSEWTKI